MRSTQSTTSPGPSPSASPPASRRTATTSRYSSGAVRRLSASSRRSIASRCVGSEKSRKSSRTAFFSFQTVSVPTNTAETCVSRGGAPASRARKAAIGSWIVGIDIAGATLPG